LPVQVVLLRAVLAVLVQPEHTVVAAVAQVVVLEETLIEETLPAAVAEDGLEVMAVYRQITEVKEAQVMSQAISQQLIVAMQGCKAAAVALQFKETE
jgi:hypothetical protein